MSGWLSRDRRPDATPYGFRPRDGTKLGTAQRLWETPQREQARELHDKSYASWSTYDHLRYYEAGLGPSRDGRIYLGRFSEPRALFGKNEVDIFSNPDHNVLIEAPSGAGKTNLMELTMLRHLGPVISTSVRWDLLMHTIEERKRRGPVYIFAPGVRNLPYETQHWSPIQDIHSWTDAIEAAKLLVAASDTNVRDKGSKDRHFWNSQARDMLKPMLFTAAMIRDLGPILKLDSYSADISEEKISSSMKTIAEWFFTGDFSNANSILDNVTASSRGILDVIEGIRGRRTINDLGLETEEMRKRADRRITEAKKIVPRENDESKRARALRDGIHADLRDIRNTLLYPAQGRDAVIEHLMQLQRDGELTSREQLFSELDSIEKEAKARIAQAKDVRTQLNSAFKFQEQGGETSVSAHATVKSILETYNDAEAYIADDMEEINIRRVLEEDGTVYILASEKNQGTYRSIIQAFLARSIAMVQDRTEELRMRGEKPSSDVEYILDELPQFGLIDTLPQIVNASRDNGLKFMASIQGNSQLKKHYGEEGAEELRTGFKTKIVMGGGGDYRDISNQVGDTRIVETSVSFDAAGKVSGRTRSYKTEPLLKNATFQNLTLGEAVVITNDFVAQTRFQRVRDMKEYRGMGTWN